MWTFVFLAAFFGLLVAAAVRAPINMLVLNDLGPEISAEALARIQAYLAVDLTFESVAALERHLRVIHAPFGALSDAQWAHLAQHSARRLPDGRVAMHYDPAICAPYRGAALGAVDLWPVWSARGCPVLAIRGAESDLLAPATYARMLAEGARGYEVAGAGHAPALMAAASIAVVRAALREGVPEVFAHPQ